jgi:hypothetical protein
VPAITRERSSVALLVLDRMKVPPSDLDTAVLARLLGEQWGMRATDLIYTPLGFADHHWSAVSNGQRYFVTVRDLCIGLVVATSGVQFSGFPRSL